MAKIRKGKNAAKRLAARQAVWDKLANDTRFSDKGSGGKRVREFIRPDGKQRPGTGSKH